MIPLSAAWGIDMTIELEKIEHDFEKLGIKSFSTFTEALKFLMEEILVDEDFIVEVEPDNFFQSDSEAITAELEKATRLQEALLMLSISTSWIDRARSKKH